MAHVAARSAYAHLVDRLNQFPQGAPPSDLLYRILGLLFTEREAELVAQLPIRPFTAARTAAASCSSARTCAAASHSSATAAAAAARR